MTRVNRMKLVELPPDVWTELPSGRFQIKGQKVVRLATSDLDGNGRTTAPAPDTEAFFLTPGYGDLPVVLGDYFGLGDRNQADADPIFAMPHGHEPIEIVVLDYRG